MRIKTQTKRLTGADRAVARRLFAVMAKAFDTEYAPLGDDYLDRLLANADFWVFAAFEGDDIVGGITAHTLPMTRAEDTEIFVYDVAVRPDRQRMGVGRQLLTALRTATAAAGHGDLFLGADNEDEHALDFYRALDGIPSPVTIFTFPAPDA
jgi:aminoglycoside 3-N-acetyltransferase I